MLDRKVVREFLEEELKETEIPDDIFKEALVEVSVSMLKIIIMNG